jgi:hypothetical protein
MAHGNSSYASRWDQMPSPEESSISSQESSSTSSDKVKKIITLHLKKSTAAAFKTRINEFKKEYGEATRDEIEKYPKEYEQLHSYYSKRKANYSTPVKAAKVMLKYNIHMGTFNSGGSQKSRKGGRKSKKSRNTKRRR